MLAGGVRWCFAWHGRRPNPPGGRLGTAVMTVERRSGKILVASGKRGLRRFDVTTTPTLGYRGTRAIPRPRPPRRIERLADEHGCFLRSRGNSARPLPGTSPGEQRVARGPPLVKRRSLKLDPRVGASARRPAGCMLPEGPIRSGTLSYAETAAGDCSHSAFGVVSRAPLRSRLASSTRFSN